VTLVRRHWFLACSIAVVAVAVVGLPLLSRWATPFHVVCVALVLLFCLPVWPDRMTAPFAAAVGVAALVALIWDVVRDPSDSGEVTELAVMASLLYMCVVLVRYVHSAARQRERNFVRETSHQLRTPLTIALGHAELMQESLASDRISPDALADDLRLVVEELKRLSAVSNRLVVMDVAQRPACDDEVDVDALVVRAIRRWQGTADRRWLASVSAHGTFPGDEEQMSLALDSLIENAVKATGDGDQIAITASALGDDVVIAVSDSGHGISEGGKHHVFDRSWRESDRQVGTGLGLTIVKAIVEHHGGSIELESSPGYGTAFSIRLGGFRAVEPGRRRSGPDTLAHAPPGAGETTLVA
jgi:signal transduction histidine kinase